MCSVSVCSVCSVRACSVSVYMRARLSESPTTKPAIRLRHTRTHIPAVAAITGVFHASDDAKEPATCDDPHDEVDDVVSAESKTEY